MGRPLQLVGAFEHRAYLNRRLQHGSFARIYHNRSGCGSNSCCALITQTLALRLQLAVFYEVAPAWLPKNFQAFIYPVNSISPAHTAASILHSSTEPTCSRRAPHASPLMLPCSPLKSVLLRSTRNTVHTLQRDCRTLPPPQAQSHRLHERHDPGPPMSRVPNRPSVGSRRGAVTDVAQMQRDALRRFACNLPA